MLILKKVCFYHGFAGGGGGVVSVGRGEGLPVLVYIRKIVIWREMQNHWRPGLAYAPCIVDTYDRPSSSSWVRLGI